MEDLVMEEREQRKKMIECTYAVCASVNVVAVIGGFTCYLLAKCLQHHDVKISQTIGLLGEVMVCDSVLINLIIISCFEIQDGTKENKVGDYIWTWITLNVGGILGGLTCYSLVAFSPQNHHGNEAVKLTGDLTFYFCLLVNLVFVICCELEDNMGNKMVRHGVRILIVLDVVGFVGGLTCYFLGETRLDDRRVRTSEAIKLIGELLIIYCVLINGIILCCCKIHNCCQHRRRNRFVHPLEV